MRVNTQLLGCLSRECIGIKREGKSRTIDAEARLAENVGELELRVLQDSAGRFATELFERYQRSEPALMPALPERYAQKQMPEWPRTPCRVERRSKNRQGSYASNHYPVSSRRSFHPHERRPQPDHLDRALNLASCVAS
jgi:hypothetical protein